MHHGFSFSNFLCRHTGDHPKEELAKFGYSSEEVENFKNYHPQEELAQFGYSTEWK
jgi:hypothetical protein